MKKVTIFGVGNMGARVAYFLARSRDVARIRLVDVDPERSRATLLDFTQSNVALQSKIAFASYEEPKEIGESDVVIVAAGVEGRASPDVSLPSERDRSTMEEIAAQIGHFAPQAVVAVLSQPAEIFCSIIARSGYFSPSKVIGFPLLIYREWFRNRIARVVGLSNEDVRITTVRTLRGEELVPGQCTVSGIPVPDVVPDIAALLELPSDDEMARRLRHHHYAAAAVISEVTGEIVSKRRQVITMVCVQPDSGAFIESKAVIGPQGVEQIIELALTEEQRARHDEYRERVISLTSLANPSGATR
jgi:malate dehydrogenase